MGLKLQVLKALYTLVFLLPLQAQSTEIPVPLAYWGEVRGELRIRVNPRTGSVVEIHKEALRLMEGATTTTPEALDGLGAGEYLTLAQWKTLGWDFVLNPETVTLAVVLSPEAERPRIISLLRRSGPVPQGTLQGAAWSAVLNSAAEARWVTFTGAGDPGSLDWEARLDFSGALRGGWSLWAAGDLDSRRTPLIDLPEARLIKDFAPEGHSLSLGFLPATGQSWVQSPPLWGFSFGTDSSLQPERDTRSSGTHFLFLKEPSTVLVRQNGQVTGRLNLPAGPLELQDIPLRQGINRVVLEITGPSGITETMEVELPFISSLLAPGIVEYHTALGIEQNYPENFRWNLQVRRGISPVLTLGAGVQGDRDEMLASGEASIATSVGAFRTDVGMGLEEISSLLQTTGALALQYDWQHASNPGLPRIGLGLQWKSEGFRSPGWNRSVVPAQTLGATGSLNVPILGTAMATLIGRTQWQPSSSQAQYQINGILSLHLGDAGILTFRGAAELPASAIWTMGASLNWSLAPGSSGFSGTLNQDLVQGNTLFQASQTWEPDPYSQSVVSFGASGRPASGDFRGGNAGLRFQNSLAEASLVHITDHLPGGTGFQHTTRIRGASSLAAADGLAALSRPLTGAFIVAEVLPEYRSFQPVLRSQTGGGAVPLMPWGTGVLGNLKAYQIHRVSPDSLSLPPGYHWGEETLLWKPERMQGVRILLGSRSIITLESRILDRTGQIVALKAGTLQSEDGRISLSFFTNRQGRFMVPGLAPGKYLLTLVDGRSSGFEVGDPQSRLEELDFIMVE